MRKVHHTLNKGYGYSLCYTRSRSQGQLRCGKVIDIIKMNSQNDRLNVQTSFYERARLVEEKLIFTKGCFYE